MLNNQVYADVFSKHPELTRMMRSLTTETRKLSEVPFLYQECHKSPNIKEISNYIDTIPNKMATFTFIYLDDKIYYVMLNKLFYNVPWFHDETVTHNLYISRLETFVEYYETEEQIWTKILDYVENGMARMNYQLKSELNEFKERFLDPDNNDKPYDMFVDVLTYYNILKRRERCTKINQTFKNVTIDYFNRTLEFINSLPYSIHMYDAYLNTNSYILNIDVPEEIKRSIIINDSSFSKEEDDEVISYYNKYIEDTNDSRQNVINTIINKILEL